MLITIVGLPSSAWRNRRRLAATANVSTSDLFGDDSTLGQGYKVSTIGFHFNFSVNGPFADVNVNELKMYR